MSPRRSWTSLLLLLPLLCTGCGAAAMELLLARTPEFVVVAERDGDTVSLRARGYDPDDVEDDLCDEDDGAGCHDDSFIAFLWYQCDDGPYGDYVELTREEQGEITLQVDDPQGLAWRTAILRDEEDEDARIVAISTAASVDLIPSLDDDAVTGPAGQGSA